MQMIRIPLIVVIGLFMGCSEPTEEAVILAKVGQHQITVDDFVAFTANIPDGMKTGSTPAESNKALLSSLIDKTLLLAEASALDLENDPEFFMALTDELTSGPVIAMALEQSCQDRDRAGGLGNRARK